MERRGIYFRGSGKGAMFHRGYKSHRSAYRPRGVKKRTSLFALFGRRRRFPKQNDLWRKNFKNPYSNRRHLPRRTKAPKTKIAFGLICVLGIAGALFFHRFFDINKIDIQGLERISREEMGGLIADVLSEKRAVFLNGGNIFLVNLKKMEGEIKKRYSLEELKIKTRLPNSLMIVLKEKTAKLILQNAIDQLNGEPKNSFFLIDQEGGIIQSINPAEIYQAPYLKILILKTQKNAELKINDAAVAPATVEFLNYLQQKIPEKTKINLAFASLVDEEGRVVHLTTIEGWKIILDRQNDWEKQLQVLTVFLRDKIKNDRSRLRYIDVRYENRSYYQ